MGEDSLWDAAWRIGYDLAQPGSGVGSAPQEAFHGAVLQGAIGETYQSPEGLYRDLQRLTRSRLVQIRNDVDILCDWPAVGRHLDLYCLRGPKMHDEGRSNAIDLVECGLLVHHTDAQGNTFVMVPKTLWKNAPRGSSRRFVRKTVEPVADEVAGRMGALL